MLAIVKSFISCGKLLWSNSWHVLLVGEGNALRTFAAVLMSISPLLAAKSITSLMRCKTRFSVSVATRLDGREYLNKAASGEYLSVCFRYTGIHISQASARCPDRIVGEILVFSFRTTMRPHFRNRVALSSSLCF